MNSTYKIKVLAHVNHYFGPSTGSIVYRSNSQLPETRRNYINKTVEALKDLGTLPWVGAVDVKICGFKGKSLLAVDKDFSFLQDPRKLVYESLAEMVGHIEEYDYFINIEDDIILPSETFSNVFEFDRDSLLNEILHPNRIEVLNGRKLPNDPMIRPRVWTFQEKQWKRHTLRVAANPHAGVLMFSREKFRYCVSNIDVNFRGAFLGVGMESAFAYFHRPFSLYRPYKNLDFHVVIHQDRHNPGWSKKATLKKFFTVGGCKDYLQSWLFD
ncbi:MAG TPA: hypothetical protein VFC44_21605 [Candidatus Saccharimonadales bacterium]|nr:hypothetical protein [Candidatus Saccharimonadales bacterium]